MNLVALGRAVPRRLAARHEWRGDVPAAFGTRELRLRDGAGGRRWRRRRTDEPHHDGRAQRGAIDLINSDRAEGRIPTPSLSLVGSSRQTAEITAMKEVLG